MSILRMERKASDNEYFHQDFYVTADNGLEYLGKNFGTEKVIEFLTFYASDICKELVQKIKINGLIELQNYFINLYTEEKAIDVLSIKFDDKILTVEISSCPAVTYMKSINHQPSKWYIETTKTLFKVISDLAGLSFEMVYYDVNNGATKLIFKEN